MSARRSEQRIIELIKLTKLVFKLVYISVFIDITGAFDNTSTETMIRGAREKKIPEWIVAWIECMLRNRRIKAACEHCDTKISPTKGCPQGGCLSPLLWSLVVDSLITRLSEVGVKITAYADDLCLSHYGPFIEQSCDTMNKALRVLEAWCMETELG